MLAIAIVPSNEELILAANEGDMPVIREADGPMYLLIENGRNNRVITHQTLMSFKRSRRTVKTMVRKVYVIKN